MTIKKESVLIDDPIHVFIDEGGPGGLSLLYSIYSIMAMNDTLRILVMFLNDEWDNPDYLDNIVVTLVDPHDHAPRRDQKDRGSPSEGPQTPYTAQREVI